MDFLEAITKRSTPILLNGQRLEVRRANLGLHYRLSVLSDQWQEARRKHDYSRAVDLTFSYVALVTGLDIEAVEQAKPFEVLIGFTILVALNEAGDALPFMLVEKSKTEYKYDYKHRGLAGWVSRLSAHYGWTAEYILDELTPEEAACYLQEAIIQDYEDKEFLYNLSDASTKVVGRGRSARAQHVPFPKPSWMGKKMPKIMVPKVWYPQGNVIEAGDLGRPAGNA